MCSCHPHLYPGLFRSAGTTRRCHLAQHVWHRHEDGPRACGCSPAAWCVFPALFRRGCTWSLLPLLTPAPPLTSPGMAWKPERLFSSYFLHLKWIPLALLFCFTQCWISAFQTGRGPCLVTIPPLCVLGGGYTGR